MKNWRFSFVLAGIIIFVAVLASGKLGGQGLFTNLSLAEFVIVFIKTILIIIILSLAGAIIFPAFIIDVILLIFTSYHFPIIRFLWELAWKDLTITWYWESSSGQALILASALIGIIGFFARR